MNMMLTSIWQKRPMALLCACSALLLCTGIQAAPLTLERAERLALQQDPVTQSVESMRTALRERAVAAGQLPDPRFKAGMMSLPTDSFNLGQEPMTQVQVGVVQTFPRGRTRSLQADLLEQHATGLDSKAEDRRLASLLSVREAYIDVIRQKKLAAINAAAIEAFTQLNNITGDYYETGRVQQQDVLRASVELARVRDRATVIAQAEDQARAKLASWIGDAAFGEFAGEWPEVAPTRGHQAILEELAQHPRLQALQQNVVAAETGIELARQKYKPEFSVDLSYGGRGGLNPDGSSRTDLLSMMVMMDVPLFTGNRQDRVVAATVAESAAAAYDRDDVYRRMRAEIDLHTANLKREQQRDELFVSTLLPDAKANSEAAFDAYQAALADLASLIRANITEFELHLEYERLQADMLKTRARLLYLQGETS